MQPSGSSTRVWPTLSASRPKSGQAMAEASADAASTTPATAYERPSPRIRSSVASGHMPTVSRASSEALTTDATPGAPSRAA